MATINKQGLTADPIQAPPRFVTAPIVPEFLRLPKPGELCAHCGMTRTAINELILPTKSNGNKPAVKSFVLRRKGAKTGIRLVDYESLRAYIRAHPQEEVASAV